MGNLSIPTLIFSSRIAIDNAIAHEPIQKAMNQYGFPLKRLQEGRALREKVVMLHGEKDEKYDEKKQVSAQIETHEQEARQRFNRHIAIVKLALAHDPVTLRTLNIKRTARKIEDWTMQATAFYKKIAAYTPLLEGYQLTVQEIAQSEAMIEAIWAARQQRMQKKGEAQNATYHRDIAAKELKAWMKKFNAVARIALADQPQLLEMLGILVVSQE